MSSSLRPGLVRTETLTVDRDRTIGFLGEEDRVYSTPSMVNDVEYACWRLIESLVNPSQTSLGVRVSLEHLGATPVGEQVSVTVRVESVEDRRVRFSALVSDCMGVVGRGEHERALVDRERHRARLAGRRMEGAARGAHAPDQ
jgi:predicted thioesterase